MCAGWQLPRERSRKMQPRGEGLSNAQLHTQRRITLK